MNATDTAELEAAKAEEILKQKLGDPKEKAIPPVTAEEDIEKSVDHKKWVFEAEYEISMKGEMRKEIFKREYIQKPLSYLAMAEFTGLLGRKLAEAMKGPDGLSLDRISPGEGIPIEFQNGQISLGNSGEEGADAIVQGIAKLASYVPDLLSEAQCIWLRVPRQERMLIMDIWSRPVDEGGMSMDQGEEMLKLFIEQNYDELDNFLKRYGRVKTVVQKMRTRNQQED